MPSVAIAHTTEKHRSFDRVLSLVKEALSHLGGMEAFVKPGQNVLVQSDHTTCGCSACTTDPLVVRALARLARQAGAAKVQVAGARRAAPEPAGLAALAAAEGAEVVDLRSARLPLRDVDIPGGQFFLHISLPAPLVEADVILAAPKAKTDSFDHIRGAMQIWVGALEQRRRLDTDDSLLAGTVDVMTVLRPDLCVTDALVCGEGNGPLANEPHWCGSIIASSDPVATDATIALLMKRNWRKLRFAEAGERRGLGSREPIVWVGTPLERVALASWPCHGDLRYLPVSLLIGEGVSASGTVGHVRSALDALLRSGALESATRLHGTPTIMLGGVEDPDFERHLSEGPYLVFDDAAQPKYKNDPRVFFVHGHPVLEEALPLLMQALGLPLSQPRPAAARAVWAGAAIGAAALGIRALARRA